MVEAPGAAFGIKHVTLGNPDVLERQWASDVIWEPLGGLCSASSTALEWLNR